MLKDITWTCHICGDERPDSKISVHSRTTVHGNVPITENIRYCNDRLSCYEGALKKHFVGDN